MDNFITDLSVLFVGASLLAYSAVLLKQPILIGYILCGILVGPWGLGLIKHIDFIENVSHIGITLLLFLAGLCLHPQKLFGLFKEMSFITVTNCMFSFLLAFLFSSALNFNFIDSLCIGLALMFSSTILIVKLLPTTKLHQQRMGAICIGILIIEDLIAVAVLAFIRCIGLPGGLALNFSILIVKLILFLVILFLLEHLLLKRILTSVERIHEVIFIIGLAWCLGIASLSNHMGLFYETGAFFAGVVLASHKISFFISERLKPLRDFFLVLFFFSLGARLDLFTVREVFLPAIALAAIFVLIKPWFFREALMFAGEEKNFAFETGMRLGQLSEFSLLIAMLALNLGHITNKAAQLIQLTTILTFIISSYIVVLKFPTPIGTTDKLNRD